MNKILLATCALAMVGTINARVTQGERFLREEYLVSTAKDLVGQRVIPKLLTQEVIHEMCRAVRIAIPYPMDISVPEQKLYGLRQRRRHMDPVRDTQRDDVNPNFLARVE